MTIPAGERESKRDVLRGTFFDVRNRVISSGIPEWMIHSGTIVKMFPYKNGLNPQEPITITGLDERFSSKVILDEPISTESGVPVTTFEVLPDGTVTTAIDGSRHTLNPGEVDLLGVTLHDAFQSARSAEGVGRPDDAIKFGAFRVEVGL